MIRIVRKQQRNSMTTYRIPILAISIVCGAARSCAADQYQLSGIVLNESNAPVAAAAVEARDTNTSSAVTGTTSSNGTYSVLLTASPGDLATISVDKLGGYYWIREQTLGTTTNLHNIDFAVPTVNTTRVSVAGAISVQGNMPSVASTIVLQKVDPVNGQKFIAIRGTIGGFSVTNTYQFIDLPTGNYNVNAHADSSTWTQVVISVTSSNTPLHLDINF